MEEGGARDAVRVREKCRLAQRGLRHAPRLLGVRAGQLRQLTGEARERGGILFGRADLVGAGRQGEARGDRAAASRRSHPRSCCRKESWS